MSASTDAAGYPVGSALLLALKNRTRTVMQYGFRTSRQEPRTAEGDRVAHDPETATQPARSMICASDEKLPRPGKSPSVAYLVQES